MPAALVTLGWYCRGICTIIFPIPLLSALPPMNIKLAFLFLLSRSSVNAANLSPGHSLFSADSEMMGEMQMKLPFFSPDFCRNHCTIWESCFETAKGTRDGGGEAASFPFNQG